MPTLTASTTVSVAAKATYTLVIDAASALAGRTLVWNAHHCTVKTTIWVDRAAGFKSPQGSNGYGGNGSDFTSLTPEGWEFDFEITPMAAHPHDTSLAPAPMFRVDVI